MFLKWTLVRPVLFACLLSIYSTVWVSFWCVSLYWAAVLWYVLCSAVLWCRVRARPQHGGPSVSRRAASCSLPLISATAGTHNLLRHPLTTLKHTSIYTFCLSACLSVCPHTFVCVSFRTHLHKAHQSPSSAFLLSLGLPACLPIYLSVIQTVTNDRLFWGGQVCGVGWGRGFTCAIWHRPAEAQ